MIRCLLLAISLFVAVSSADAASLYVRTDGHDTNCNGTADASAASAPNCAKLTLNGANAIVAAGDTVNIANGEYDATATLSTSGSEGSVITYTGTTSAWIKQRLTISGNYITVNGIRYGDPTKAPNSGTSDLSLTGNNNTITNVLHNPDGGGGQSFALSGTAANNTISTFEITDVNFATLILMYDGTSGNTITSGSIHDTVDVDISHIWGTNNTFQDTEITSNVRVDELQHCDILQLFPTTNAQTANGIVLQRLYVHDTDSNIGYLMGGSNFTGTVAVTLRNNIFLSLTGELRASIQNLKLYNNLFKNCGGDNGWTIQIGGASPSYDNDNLEIINNIFLSDETRIWTENNSGHKDYTHTNNYYGKLDYTHNAHYGEHDPQSIASIAEATMVDGGDPKFTNDAGKDFTLASGSPLADVGATIATFSADKNSIARPQGVAWDIGPYEYPAGGGTTYTVTPSATNCTLSPGVAQSTDGTAVAFTATGAYGYTASVSGCSGTLSGSTFTTDTISGNCTVTCTGQPHFATLGGSGTITLGGSGTITLGN